MKLKVFITAFLFVFVSSNLFADERVKGNGQLERLVLEIDDFSALRVNAVIDLVYEQTDGPSTLEVIIDENLHPFVKAEVKNRTLHLGFTGAKVDHFTKFIVKASSKWLSEVRLDDNAGFHINGPLTGDEFKIRVGASALVELKNPVEVGKLIIDASNSANVIIEDAVANEIDASAGVKATIYLKGGTAKVGKYSSVSGGEVFALGYDVPVLSASVTGNGIIEAYCSNALKARVVGKGTIRYKGAVTVESSKIGGTIEEVKEEANKKGVIPSSEFSR